MSSLQDLKPQPLWNHFARLAAIPHASGDEAALRAAIRALAQARGFDHEIDAGGNLLVRKPAAPGREAGPGTVVQAHLDMVCEKLGHSAHDFTTDALRLKVDRSGWLSAEGTTLGADNGIGVAAMMALMEDRDLIHGPLELLFTVGEESGMHGARQLRRGWLRGRYLINLDAERDDTIIIGCAGSRCTTLDLHLATAGPGPDEAAARICITGLLGGHSGMDIHRGRANPIRLMVRLVESLESALAVRLSRLEAGRSINALAREAEAVVCYPVGRWHRLAEMVAGWQDVFRREHAGTETGLRIELQAVGRECAPLVLTGASQRAVLDLLTVLPHGVLAMSGADPGLVDTSSNLAAAVTAKDLLTVSTKQRSLVESRLEAACQTVVAAGRLAGATARFHGAYPSWSPRAQSTLLTLASGIYPRLFATAPKLRAMHAGLECGLMAQAYPEIEIVAIGPNILDPHSPDERVEIASVVKFWRFLTALLGEL